MIKKWKNNLTKKVEIVCNFWACDIPVSKKDHKFCFEHWLDDKDGFLDKCPDCKKYKDVMYEFCLDCKSFKNGKYKKEHSVAWEKSDLDVSTFFVYILKLNDGKYYAGQTNNLRRRIYQHKEKQTTKSTKGKEAKLLWFAPLPSRDSAERAEVELKKLIDKNPSAIDEKIITFRDLIKESS